MSVSKRLEELLAARVATAAAHCSKPKPTPDNPGH